MLDVGQAAHSILSFAAQDSGGPRRRGGGGTWPAHPRSDLVISAHSSLSETFESLEGSPGNVGSTWDLATRLCCSVCVCSRVRAGVCGLLVRAAMLCACACAISSVDSPYCSTSYIPLRDSGGTNLLQCLQKIDALLIQFSTTHSALMSVSYSNNKNRKKCRLSSLRNVVGSMLMNTAY